MTKAASRAAGPRLNPGALVRRMQLRRGLRVLLLAELVLLALWIVYGVTMEHQLASDTPAWTRVDSAIGPVLLVLLAAIALSAVALLLTRLDRPEGPAAAVLVPALGRRREPRIGPATTALATGPRTGYLSPGALIVAIGSLAVAVYTALSVVPVWRANHGHGGTPLTIGQNAFYAYRKWVSDIHHGGGRWDYYMNTPVGTVPAASGKPLTGQHWTLYETPFGVHTSVRVGGHDYIWAGLVLLLALAVFVLAAAVQITVARDERRRRAAQPRTIEESTSDRRRFVERELLSAAAGTEVRVADRRVGVLAGPVGTVDDVVQSLRRRRLLGLGAAGAVAVACIVTLTGQQLGLFSDPPTMRDVYVRAVAGTGWNPEVTAFYHADPDLLRSYAGSQADQISAVRDLVVDRADAPTADDRPSANVTVARIGRADGVAMVTSWTRFRTDTGGTADKVAPVTSLPPSWTAYFTTSSGTDALSSLDAVRVVHGVFIEITMTDVHVDGSGQLQHWPRAQIEAWIRPLATALENGATQVEHATRRPAHG